MFYQIQCKYQHVYTYIYILHYTIAIVTISSEFHKIPNETWLVLSTPLSESNQKAINRAGAVDLLERLDRHRLRDFLPQLLDC